MTGVFLLWQPETTIASDYPYLFGAWTSIGLTEWLVLVGLAVLTIIIGIGMAGAYQAAPPQIISTFEYSYLVFVAVWDLLFFDTSPTATTLIGMIMIISAGLMILRRG